MAYGIPVQTPTTLSSQLKNELVPQQVDRMPS